LNYFYKLFKIAYTNNLYRVYTHKLWKWIRCSNCELLTSTIQFKIDGWDDL